VGQPERARSTEPDPAAPSVRGHAVYRWRSRLASAGALPLIVASLTSAPWFPPRSGLGIALENLGWLAGFAYVALRAWATLYIGGRKDRELQTEGPYALCRNPLYLGSFALACAAACFLQRAVFAAGVAALATLYVLRVIPAEERHLALRFGATYRAYCERTARFWPRTRPALAERPVEVSPRAVRAELRRLARAIAALVVLHTLAQARDALWLPQWFGRL
jgi:protein-S-isoprenylcysteine O-methyltransferase Ste14